MSTTDFPHPADWPVPQTVTCSICNNPCQVIMLERGSAVATYICAEQHDTPYLAKKNSAGEWEYGEVPF